MKPPTRKKAMLDNFRMIEAGILQAAAICGKSGNTDCRGNIYGCPFKDKVDKDTYCVLTVLSEAVI
jgi:hypothetical protein